MTRGLKTLTLFAWRKFWRKCLPNATPKLKYAERMTEKRRIFLVVDF